MLNDSYSMCILCLYLLFSVQFSVTTKLSRYSVWLKEKKHFCLQSISNCKRIEYSNELWTYKKNMRIQRNFRPFVSNVRCTTDSGLIITGCFVFTKFFQELLKGSSNAQLLMTKDSFSSQTWAILYLNETLIKSQ